jgi:hypothetical protein
MRASVEDDSSSAAQISREMSARNDSRSGVRDSNQAALWIAIAILIFFQECR